MKWKYVRCIDDSGWNDTGRLLNGNVYPVVVENDSYYRIISGDQNAYFSFLKKRFIEV